MREFALIGQGFFWVSCFQPGKTWTLAAKISNLAILAPGLTFSSLGYGFQQEVVPALPKSPHMKVVIRVAGHQARAQKPS